MGNKKYVDLKQKYLKESEGAENPRKLQDLGLDEQRKEIASLLYRIEDIRKEIQNNTKYSRSTTKRMLMVLDAIKDEYACKKSQITTKQGAVSRLSTDRQASVDAGEVKVIKTCEKELERLQKLSEGKAKDKGYTKSKIQITPDFKMSHDGFHDTVSRTKSFLESAALEGEQLDSKKAAEFLLKNQQHYMHISDYKQMS